MENKNFFYVSRLLLRNENKFDCFAKYLYRLISDLVSDYPNFNSWYFNKVIPEVKEGKREIISYIYQGNIAGFAIIKNTTTEKKICTIRVLPKFQNMGIGKQLFEKSFYWLNTQRPLITVSESRINQFKSIFDYYGFNLSNVHPNCYIYGNKEYVYNGTLFVNESSNEMNKNIRVP